MSQSTSLAPLLERFFVERLINQRQASPPHRQVLSGCFAPAAAFHAAASQLSAVRTAIRADRCAAGCRIPR